MKKFVVFLGLAAIVLLSYGLMTGLFSEPALVEATGPILGMTVAASLDEQGQPVDASFTYPIDQPEMVVLVWIGELTPGPLTFSWYRVTDAGDEALFEQTVAVEARDVAFSSGLNPGILAAATYKVVATFAGGSEMIVWDVAAPQTGDLTALADTSGSAAGGTPTPGPSGTTPVVVPQPGSLDVSGPRVRPNIFLVNRAPVVGFLPGSAWIDARGFDSPSPISFTVQVTPAITGSAPGASRQYTHAAGTIETYRTFFLDPCSLPDGSDLPDTSITVTTVPLGYEARSNSQTKTLGQDTSLPFAVVDESVYPGQKVNPGDQIVLKVTGKEVEFGSWQTGIWQMQVTGPNGLVGEAWTNPSRLPLPCVEDRSSPEVAFTYTVPPNPPATIELCVLVEDYNDNFNQRDCRTYYTGNQLEGKLTWKMTVPAFGGTNVHRGDAELFLTLQTDNTLTGTAQINYSFNGQGTDDCGPWSWSIRPMQLTLPVSGVWTKTAIGFHFTPDAPIVATLITSFCGEAGQIDVTTDFLDSWVRTEWGAAWDWDGQAYAANDRVILGSDELHYTIHLEPPAPD